MTGPDLTYQLNLALKQRDEARARVLELEGKAGMDDEQATEGWLFGITPFEIDAFHKGYEAGVRDCEAGRLVPKEEKREAITPWEARAVLRRLGGLTDYDWEASERARLELLRVSEDVA